MEIVHRFIFILYNKEKSTIDKKFWLVLGKNNLSSKKSIFSIINVSFLFFYNFQFNLILWIIVFLFNIYFII